MGILKSIPFEEVDIKVIDIEYKHIGKIFPVSYQELKYSCSKSARKYYVTSLFTLLRTQFLSDFLEGIRGSNLGRSFFF